MNLTIWHTALLPQYDGKIHPRTLENVNKWVALNPELAITRNIVSDNDAIEILSNFDKKYNQKATYFFRNEPDGRFKSDLLRLVLLFKFGGMYIDIDQEPLVPIKDFLDLNDVDFCIGASSPRMYVCNGIIYAKEKHNMIIKTCLETHLERYEQLFSGIRLTGDMSATHTMHSAITKLMGTEKVYPGFVDILGNRCLFTHEKGDMSIPESKEHYESYAFYANNDQTKIMTTRYLGYYEDKLQRNMFVKFKTEENFNHG